ncbi:MAG: hypothetical protein KA124_10310, partial [Luteimonas sp.]|nr:hypothetical protein [Luteimonas sp.]
LQQPQAGQAGIHFAGASAALNGKIKMDPGFRRDDDSCSGTAILPALRTTCPMPDARPVIRHRDKMTVLGPRRDESQSHPSVIMRD